MANQDENAADKGVVVVTGATGYVATHVVQQLQQAGYRVRGTVRQLPDWEFLKQESSLEEQLQDANVSESGRSEIVSKQEKVQIEKKKRDKIQFLYDLCPDAKHKLELLQADLLESSCWDDVIAGATYVLHVASPFTFDEISKDNDLVKPAVDGTRNVLGACAKAGTVEIVVVTSSILAIADIAKEGEFTEEMWASPEDTSEYAKSKVLAERAAWDFLKTLPDEKNFKMVVINPAMVFGPALNKTAGASIGMMKALMMKGYSALPKFPLGIVDVRDVAACHIKALTTPEAYGHRHILSSTEKCPFFYEIAEILAEEFRPQGYVIITRRAPNFLLWILSFFDKFTKGIVKGLSLTKIYKNKRMREVLGVMPRDMRETIIEMAYSLIEQGFVPKTAQYKGPPEKEVS